ncbi:hypothetical protein Adeg_1826 [Ammonifex degensii KC4]|uniref:Uncharacterized protein n=1 Tax=Ammonifex degensii (strain DSM 10501 / KC4) TaxID=429009 RepID=C9R9D3_AMMDK|nr:hypothetical protein [Ammonifex degensii]ACX52912.1 hypothetical protein Adeg_1826 [Ammonifex degensii KC4]
MTKLSAVFALLEAAGYKLRPVPGTKWYEVSGPEGWVVLVKEKDLVMAFDTEEPERFWEWFQKLEPKEEEEGRLDCAIPATL